MNKLRKGETREKCGCVSNGREWTLMCHECWTVWNATHQQAQADHQLRENEKVNPDAIPAPTWCDVGPHPDGRACAACVGTMEHHLIMKGAYGT